MKPYEFNREKFDNLVHYIIWKCPDPGKLGSTKLQKILWRSDTRMYMESGLPITGARYRRQKFGPATDELLRARERLKESGRIYYWDNNLDWSGRAGPTTIVPKDVLPRIQARVKQAIYISREPPPINFLSEKEKQTVDFWISEICLKYTAEKVSDETHGYAWEIIPMGEEMPLYSIFLDRVKDEPSVEVMEWAINEVRGLG